jgi:hypothetical protein
MRFKQFLSEMELAGIEPSQAEDAHEPTGEGKTSVDNPKVRMEMNYRLVNELYTPFLSPEGGIQAIRKVLHRFGFDMPALYDADSEGDEIVFELNQYGLGEYETNIYILYYLTDEGHYEFYAEIGDDERMEELLSDEELDEEEE